MSPLLVRFGVRSLLRHPLLTALSVLGIALGVAVVVSIDLANQSARRAFSLSAEAVGGRATHWIIGGPSGIPDDTYRRLKVDLGIDAAAPVVEGTAQLEGQTFHILGVDPFAEAPFRSHLGGARVDLRTLLTQPGAVLMSQRAANGREVGTKMTLRIGGVVRPLVLAGLLPSNDTKQQSAIDDLLVCDVSAAQELLGKEGRLDRIELMLDDGTAEALSAKLPPGLSLEPSSSRSATLDQLTRAFRTNLSALSLLALLVGMFLIYNTMTFSVVQRRPLLGILRALGVTRREVFAIVLGEAAVQAVVGTALGLVGGVLLGRGLVTLVTRTVNDLYFTVNVRELWIEPWTLAKGLSLGLGATLVAALFPALEATRAPPTEVLRRSTVEEQARASTPRLALLGVACSLLGLGLLWLPTRALGPAFAGLLCLLLGFSLAVPLATERLALAARSAMSRSFGLLGKMAASGVVTSLSRTGVAVASLTIAVATTVAVGAMVGSFRGTVVRWLEASLIADVYVSAPSAVFRRGDGTLAPDVIDRARRVSGVTEVISVRNTRVRWKDRSVDLGAVDFGERQERPYRFKSGNPSALWQMLEQTDALVVSEPFSFHQGVEAGDTMVLLTDHGERPFQVVGVYFDYASDVGAALISRRTYERHFDDRGLTGLGLFLAPGTDIDQVVAQLRRPPPGGQEALVRASRSLRESSLEVFDRTFTITQVLRLLAVGVAFIGVLSALMALQLERARELAVLRAIGLLPREVWRLVSLQTALLGLISGLLALPLGVMMAYVLVHVINKRSFGWTLQLTVSPALLGQAVVLAVSAALIAGLYPAWKMSRQNPAAALKDS